MAAVVATVLARSGSVRTESMRSMRGAGEVDSVAAARHIQRVFRGHRERKPKASDYVIDPQRLEEALERHKRERAGFKSLCAFVAYSLLFMIVSINRSAPGERYDFESSFAEALAEVQTPSGAGWADVKAPDDVYDMLEATILQLSHYPDDDIIAKGAVTLTDSTGLPEIVNASLLNMGNGWVLESPLYADVYALAEALQPELFLSDSTFGYSCAAHVAARGLPHIASYWSILEATMNGFIFTLRGSVYGDAFPSTEQGHGRIITHSRVIGAMTVSQSRRAPADCDVGVHSGSVDSCLSESEESEEEIAGAATGRKFKSRASEPTRYYQLFDLGKFGLGVRTMQCQLDMLRADSWLNEETKHVQVSLSIINGNLQLLGRADIHIDFTLGGAAEVSPQVRSVKVFDNVLGGGYSTRMAVAATILLLWTAVLFVWLFVGPCFCGASHNVWYFIDLGMYLIIVLAEMVNQQLVAASAEVVAPATDDIMTSEDPFEVIIAFNQKLESASDTESRMRTITTIAYLLVLLRLLKALHFHDRLAVITRTLEAGTGELLHFGMVFACVTCLYAAVASNSLGSLLRSYRSFTESYTTLFLMLLGDFDYGELEEVSPLMGPLIFWSYIIIVFYLLTNVFLSIVVDSFIVIKERAEDSDSFLASLAQTIHARVYEICSRFSRSRNSVAPGSGEGGVRVMVSSAGSGNSPAASAKGSARYKKKADMGVSLSPPVRDSTLAKLLRPLTEKVGPLDRMAVRKAIGVQYSRATVTAIMHTFGQPVDLEVRKAKDEEFKMRQRFQQKAVLRMLQEVKQAVVPQQRDALSGVQERYDAEGKG